MVERVLVMPRDHALAKRKRVSFADVGGARFVMPPEGGPHRAVLDAAFRTHRARVEIGAIARGWELTLKLVELGFGCAIVNGCCAIPRGLVARPMRELAPVDYVAFTRVQPSRVARALVEALVAHGSGWRERSLRRAR